MSLIIAYPIPDYAITYKKSIGNLCTELNLPILIEKTIQSFLRPIFSKSKDELEYQGPNDCVDLTIKKYDGEFISNLPMTLKHLRLKNISNIHNSENVKRSLALLTPQTTIHMKKMYILKNINMGHNFNQELIPGTFPKYLKYLTHLTLGSKFNQIIRPGELPKYLQHLTLGPRFNQEIIPGALPKYLRHLIFGSDFNQVLELGALPKNLTHIHFGSGFNQTFKPGVIPSTITHITFD
jgi:hypothetical protein